MISPSTRLRSTVWNDGGEGGIRTHGTLPRTAVFKTAALNHSATSPSESISPIVTAITRSDFEDAAEGQLPRAWRGEPTIGRLEVMNVATAEGRSALHVGRSRAQKARDDAVEL